MAVSVQEAAITRWLHEASVVWILSPTLVSVCNFPVAKFPHKLPIKITALSYIPNRDENWYSDKHIHRHVPAALSAAAKRQKALKGTAVGEQSNTTWSLHPVEACSAIKTDEALTQETIRMNPENIPLGEWSQIQRDKYGMIAILRNVRNRHIHRIKRQTGGYQGWEREKGDRVPNGYWAFVSGWWKYSGTRDRWWLYDTVKVLDAPALWTLQGLILHCVKCTSSQKYTNKNPNSAMPGAEYTFHTHGPSLLPPWLSEKEGGILSKMTPGQRNQIHYECRSWFLIKERHLTRALKTDQQAPLPHLMNLTALQRFCLSLGQVPLCTGTRSPKSAMGRAGGVSTPAPHVQRKKKQPPFYILKGKALSGKKHGGFPRGEIFRRFKDTPGMSCHSSFFHFDLH